MEVKEVSTTDVPQYGRVKGAEWFPFLYKKDILVLGQGGIGSWVSFLLARIGCNLYLYDHDQYELHNQTGQVVRLCDIGKNKAEAAKEIIREFSPDCQVETYGKYDDMSMTNDIILCGFDNMEARKVAFSNWLEYVNDPIVDGSKCLFIDGRLNAEYLQIFCIKGDDVEAIVKYQSEYLFDDAEVQEQDCTFKQTSHCAAMIGSLMVTFLTNWATNVMNDMEIRQVPFMHDYLVPLNMSTHV